MVGNWNKYAKDYAAVKPESNQKFESVPNGAYAVQIMGVTMKNTTNRSYIELMLEITEGEYKGFFSKDYKSQPDNGNKRWRGCFNVWIPEQNDEEWKVNQFLRTIKAIDVSNGTTFDGNEATLKGKKVCALMHKEEYLKDGEVKSVQKFYKLISIQDMKDGRIGEIKDKLIPDDKKDKIFDSQAAAPAAAPLPDVLSDFVDVTSDVISDGELPF